MHQSRWLFQVLLTASLGFLATLFSPQSSSANSQVPNCSCDAFDYYTKKSQEETAKIDERIQKAKKRKEREYWLKVLKQVMEKYEERIQTAFNQCQQNRFGCGEEEKPKSSRHLGSRDHDDDDKDHNHKDQGGGGSSESHASHSSGVTPHGSSHSGPRSGAARPSSGPFLNPVNGVSTSISMGGPGGHDPSLSLQGMGEEREQNLVPTEIYEGTIGMGMGSVGPNADESLGYLTIEEIKKRKKKKGEADESESGDNPSQRKQASQDLSKGRVASSKSMTAGATYYIIGQAPPSASATGIVSLKNIQQAAHQITHGSSLKAEASQPKLYEGYLSAAVNLGAPASRNQNTGLSSEEQAFLADWNRQPSTRSVRASPSHHRRAASQGGTSSEPLALNKIVAPGASRSEPNRKGPLLTTDGRPKWISYLPKFIQESSILTRIFPKRQPAQAAIDPAAQIAGMHTDIFYNINRAYQFTGGSLKK